MSVWKFDQIQCIAASKQVPSIELIFSIVNFLRELGIGSISLGIKKHHFSSFNRINGIIGSGLEIDKQSFWGIESSKN